MSASIINIYITFPNEAAAESLTQHLIASKLIACANIFPIKSAYWWNNNIARDNEWAALCKSSNAKWEEIVQIVTQKHEYEVPCIEKWAIETNPAYAAWVLNSLNRLNTE